MAFKIRVYYEGLQFDFQADNLTSNIVNVQRRIKPNIVVLLILTSLP